MRDTRALKEGASDDLTTLAKQVLLVASLLELE